MTCWNWVQKALLFEKGGLKFVSEAEERRQYERFIKRLKQLKKQQKR